MEKKYIDYFDYLLNKKHECLMNKCDLLKNIRRNFEDIAKCNGIIEGLNIAIDLFSYILQKKVYTNNDIEDVKE